MKEGMLGEKGSQGTMSMLERFRLRSLRDVEKNEVCRERMEEDENQMVDEKDVVVGGCVWNTGKSDSVQFGLFV